MWKSFKVMLLPNNKQNTRLFQFAGSARFAYNCALKKEMDAFTNGENFISPDDLRKEFTRKSKRKGDFSFYQDTAKIQITDTHVKLESISTGKRRNRQRLNWIKLAEVGRIPVGAKYENPRISFDGLN